MLIVDTNLCSLSIAEGYNKNPLHPAMIVWVYDFLLDTFPFLFTSTKWWLYKIRDWQSFIKYKQETYWSRYIKIIHMDILKHSVSFRGYIIETKWILNATHVCATFSKEAWAHFHRRRLSRRARASDSTRWRRPIRPDSPGRMWPPSSLTDGCPTSKLHRLKKCI